MHRKIAIITGSSSGIGKAFLELTAGDNGEFFKTPFDEIWAIARREDASKEIASSVGNGRIIPIAADLSDDSGITVIENKLKAEDLMSDCLSTRQEWGSRARSWINLPRLLMTPSVSTAAH